jgi:glycosyltransferase involved in cell wall biosynthesis
MYDSQIVRDEFEDEGVRVVRLPFPRYRLGWIAARYRLYREFAKLAHSGQLDIISSPDYEGWIAGWPRLPIPALVRLHGSSTYFAAEMNQPIQRSARWLEGMALRRADFWCSVSRYTAEKTKQLFQLKTDPTAILYNPIEIAPLDSSLTRSPHDVLFTGTLTTKKGVVPLVRAWPNVVKACPQAKLHIYGKDGRAESGGSMRAYLESLLDSATQASVIFHGHQPRPAILQALRTARLAVFPSYAEAFAIAPLEAMACQCPTIYSERGSGPELITHGTNGLLIDPDQPAQLTQNIVQLLTDDGLAERLGRAGYDHVAQHFSLDEVIKHNETFYRHCIRTFQQQRGGKISAAAASHL